MKELWMNKEGLLRSIILFSFSYFLLTLLATGKISYYINPRFIPLTYFTVIVTLAMFFVQFKQSFRTRGSHLKPAYAIFLIPILLGLLVPAKPLDATVAAKKGISQTQPSAQFSYEDEAARLKEEKNIVITEKNFALATSEINTSPQLYKGRTITLTGFVYTDDSFSKNIFAAARYMISCCSADAMVLGLLCEPPGKLPYPQGTWVNIKGTMDIKVFNNEEVPLIKVEEISKTVAPEDPYVY